VLAALAAVVSGVFARSAKPAQAATGNNFVLGQNNSASALTRLDLLGDQGRWSELDTGNAIAGFITRVGCIRLIRDSPEWLRHHRRNAQSEFCKSTGIRRHCRIFSSAGYRDCYQTRPRVLSLGQSRCLEMSMSWRFRVAPDPSAAIYRLQVNLSVSGTKSARVRTSDGVNRLLFCVESNGVLVEDLGEGKLEKGTAEIANRSALCRRYTCSDIPRFSYAIRRNRRSVRHQSDRYPDSLFARIGVEQATLPLAIGLWLSGRTYQRFGYLEPTRPSLNFSPAHLNLPGSYKAVPQVTPYHP